VQRKIDNFEQMKRILIILGFAALLGSCLKPVDYPNQPVLNSAAINLLANSAELNLDFTDGDGNFGLDQDDTLGSFGLCEHRYNVYCYFYYRNNGLWTAVDLNDCINPNATPFHLRAPWVKPTGQNQTQKGQIKVELNDYFPDSEVNTGYSVDTCKFDIYLTDRDFNISNTLSTNEFLVD
jgi:hypothetical protein